MVTVFYDHTTSCNPLSISEAHTATGCRHDHSAFAYVLLSREDRPVQWSTLLSTSRHCTAPPLLYCSSVQCSYYTCTAKPLLHCSAPTTHFTPLLHCTVLTTLHHHYFTAQCCALWRPSPALHVIALYCLAQCNTLHCISLHFTSTVLHYTMKCYTLHCISQHFASTAFHWLRGAVLHIALNCTGQCTSKE